MKRHYDIAVIGSGFAGSLMAMIARRIGHSVVLIERGSHPRVVIGESSTPLANLLLEELATQFDLPFLTPLTKWESWQRTYPALSSGLKRGFSFFNHELGLESDLRAVEERQLLVAASPHNRIADTHWFRADLDQFLVEQAKNLDVDYFDHVILGSCTREENGWRLSGSRDGTAFEIKTSFMIDATGPRGFLHHAMQLQEMPIAGFPATSSLYGHFSGVKTFQETSGWPATGADYAIDDAAVHHVFDGGWIWVLRFNNGWTSAGVAATAEVASRFNFADGAAAWHRLLNTLPLVKAQFANAVLRVPFRYVPRLSFLSSRIAGDRWAMLPTAAGFVDPLLSTGIPLALLGIARLAEIIRLDWECPTSCLALSGYADKTRSELLATSDLIGGLYRNMGNFANFRLLSLLYFAAATYSESARRLGKIEWVPGFLLHDHPVFGARCRQILAAGGTGDELERNIYDLIEGFDLAGLGRRPKDHAYPVNVEDLFASAHKLGASKSDIQNLLVRSGFFNAANSLQV